jgi:hypothetical protein
MKENIAQFHYAKKIKYSEKEADIALQSTSKGDKCNYLVRRMHT